VVNGDHALTHHERNIPQEVTAATQGRVHLNCHSELLRLLQNKVSILNKPNKLWIAVTRDIILEMCRHGYDMMTAFQDRMGSAR
jgi:hypothetical protein